MKKFIKKLTSYAFIILGALLASFSVACILLPNDAIDYGTAGIAIIINKLTGFDLSLSVLCVLCPFLILGIVFLGRSFSVKAILGSIVYTVGLSVFENMPFEIDTEHFLAVAFGGAILGVGLSLILRNGGCIDGSEIFANILLKIMSSKTGKNYSMSPILIGFNVCVYMTAFLIIDRNGAMLSLLVYFVATAIIDHFTDHFEAVKQVTIITHQEESIVKCIKERMNKTCTVIKSWGAVAGENSTVICYVNYFELQKLREIIAEHKGSFSTISTVEEILQ